eukprot:UN01947
MDLFYNIILSFLLFRLFFFLFPLFVTEKKRKKKQQLKKRHVKNTKKYPNISFPIYCLKPNTKIISVSRISFFFLFSP